VTNLILADRAMCCSSLGNNKKEPYDITIDRKTKCRLLTKLATEHGFWGVIISIIVQYAYVNYT
jgi:hypothetical protein